MNTDNEDNAKSKGSKKSMQGWSQRVKVKEELHLYKVLRVPRISQKGYPFQHVSFPDCAWEYDRELRMNFSCASSLHRTRLWLLLTGNRK